jgi:alcohol dehydrogenase YqhD (iron-dependent ADH family)
VRDFWFCNPTKIIFGSGKSNEIAKVIEPFGKRVLFVYGQKSIKESGLYQRVRKLLEDNSFQILEHGGVASNPTVEHVRLGVSLAKSQGIDCVLAVGGGSVIDTAKAIAFGVCTEDDVWNFFVNRTKPQSALPVFTILTIPGSGSEMNAGVVITNSAAKLKLAIGAPCLAPKVSILDPSLTMTVPKEYTVYGLVDAFSHVMEAYFNGEELSILTQDQISEGIFRSLIGISKLLLRDLDNYDYRAEAMWGACMAHNGLLSAGRGKIVHEIHCLAHCLGAIYPIAHGAAISLAVLAWLNFRRSKLQEKIAQFGIRVFGVSEYNDKFQQANEAIVKLKEWLNSIKSPLTLEECGIKQRLFTDIANNLERIAIGGGMRDVSQNDIEQLVKLVS